MLTVVLQVMNAMIGDFDLFIYNLRVFFKLVCALDEIVVLINLFFQLFKTITYKCCAFPVGCISTYQRSQKAENGDNYSLGQSSTPSMIALCSRIVAYCCITMYCESSNSYEQCGVKSKAPAAYLSSMVLSEAILHLRSAYSLRIRSL